MRTGSCGNCPARREGIRTATCCIYGELPWGEFDGGAALDMIRPDACKSKPRSQVAIIRRIREASKCAP